MRKDSVRYETFRREALLLKGLRHPGIPVIYDLEEDENFGYLIEEYLQGDSLETIAGERSPLPIRSILQYAIQICSVVSYLHSAGPEPILHLDLQPKNLLICGHAVKLIDFDQASTRAQANQIRRRFGTVGFAAPEQYDFTRELDERTDIYAIGCLLFYLTTGSCPDRKITPAVLGQKMWSREAGRIVAACLDPDGDRRYGSAALLQGDLEALLRDIPSSLVIAVYGNEPCTGATHLSLALCASLWRKGITNRYEECHPFGNIRRLQEKGSRIDENGCFRAWGCMLKPYYGRQASFLPGAGPGVIQDRGALERADGLYISEEEPAAVILTAGGKWWNRPPDEEFIRIYEKRLILLYDFSPGSIGLSRPRVKLPGRILRMPLFANPFVPDRRAEQWMDMLWSCLVKIFEEQELDLQAVEKERMPGARFRRETLSRRLQSKESWTRRLSQQAAGLMTSMKAGRRKRRQQ